MPDVPSVSTNRLVLVAQKNGSYETIVSSLEEKKRCNFVANRLVIFNPGVKMGKYGISSNVIDRFCRVYNWFLERRKGGKGR